MMYMPDISLSRSRIQIGNYGTVALFNVGEIKDRSVDDPYRRVLEELGKE